MERRYRPANGSEGMAFMDAWCCNCARDANGDCQILAATFVFDVDDPNYPKEWVEDAVRGPHCTAFVEQGREIPYRCPRTPDLFDLTNRERE